MQNIDTRILLERVRKDISQSRNIKFSPIYPDLSIFHKTNHFACFPRHFPPTLIDHYVYEPRPWSGKFNGFNSSTDNYKMVPENFSVLFDLTFLNFKCEGKHIYLFWKLLYLIQNFKCWWKQLRKKLETHNWDILSSVQIDVVFIRSSLPRGNSQPREV